MKKYVKYLDYLALTLFILALISFIISQQKKTTLIIFAILAIASIGAYTGRFLLMILSVPKHSLKRKSYLYSGNLLLIIILVLGILALFNYFFARHHHRFDFTESKLHSLSDKSVTVLKDIKNDINIKCFFLEGNFGRSKMENLLKIYNYHSKKIKYEFIDPDKNPGMVKRYEITEDATSIFESGDKESRITSSNEEDITNAIIKVTREEKKVIYFLEGHGESSIEESEAEGYSLAKEELEKLAYEVKKISLALSETFPKDCSLLVIPGPEKDLLPDELETIRIFIKEGGRVFFMVDPQNAPELKSFLSEYGIQLEEDLIVDTVSRLLGGDYFMPVISEYEYHEITKKFRYATFFPFARSVDTARKKPEGISTETLAKTSPNSWSERQLAEKEVSFDKDKDKPGPIPLAVVLTIETKDEKEDEVSEEEIKEEIQSEEKKEKSEIKQEGRMAVFGDSDFITNRYYHLSGNGNFFLNTVNWLTEEADLISIQPKTSSPRTIQLTPHQGRMIFFVSLFILPLAALLTGISIWVRRRSL